MFYVVVVMEAAKRYREWDVFYVRCRSVEIWVFYVVVMQDTEV